MTATMRAAMYDEARLFFESIVRENRSLMSLVDCDYTFLNGTLATLYGLDKKVTGPRWRKVKMTDLRPLLHLDHPPKSVVGWPAFRAAKLAYFQRALTGGKAYVRNRRFRPSRSHRLEPGG